MGGASVCTACVAGRYQESAGQSECMPCEAGKYGRGTGSTSASVCGSCQPGTYSATAGASNCTQCRTGQVQPNEGQVSCNDCSLESKIKTNNAAHTFCIDDQALLSTSLIELMFNKGVALALAFIIAAIFLSLSMAIHYMKAKFLSEATGEDGLAGLEIWQVVLKSVLPGFSFGSEVVLIWGLMTEAQGIGGVMLAFRLLHPCTMTIVAIVMFVSDAAYMPERLRKMVRMSRFNEKFVRKNVPLVGMLLLTTGCEVTMVQLMPWQQSRFYEESIGYPCFDLMTVCMVVKTLQSFVSVICQAAYMMIDSDLSDPTMSIQARILFSLSIALSMVTLIMGVMTLSLKYALLRKVADEEEQEAERKRKQEEEGKKRREEEQQEQEESGLEMGDVYGKSNEELAMDSIPNPMHSAALEMVEKQKEEIEKQNEELRVLREENKAQELEICRLKQQLQQ